MRPIRRQRPKRLALSPTKISTYLACRVMYKYTYIDRISRFYYKPKSYHSFGSSLHRTLEEFHKAGGAETQSPEELVGKLHHVWTSQGYASAEEEQQKLVNAEEILEAYHTEYVVKGAQTIFTEKQIKHDMGEFDLLGRIDRLDEYPDGRLEVIDYKSGRLNVSEDEVRDDLAMGIYAYLVSRSYPNKQISSTIYCLRSGNTATVYYTPEELSEIEDGVAAVAEDIARVDEDSEFEPVWLPYVCPECDYLKLCARRMDWDLSGMLNQ